MKSLPWLAASAVDEPEMPAKKTDKITLICASPPGKWPTKARDRRINRSVMPPLFIKLAVSRKKGTANKMNELYDLNISLNKTMGDKRGSKMRMGKAASPSAKATGTRIANSKKKPPKRTSAAIEGDKSEALKSRTPG